MLKKLALLMLPTLIAGGMDYVVHFIGLNDSDALQAVKSASLLTKLKKNPPDSLNSLRFRAESDIPDMVKALQAHGYYEASIRIQIEEDYNDVWIDVMISPGPVYLISEFNTEVVSEDSLLQCSSLEPHNLGIEIGKPAITSEILHAEQEALSILGSCGYPLATIENREMIADHQTKTLAIHLKIDAGSLSRFGATSISGVRRIKTKLFDNKTAWKPGEVYDNRLVQKTQKQLLDTGLFRSVIISHDSELNAQKELPMRIDAAESKHKSVNLGASYQTYFGPGFSVGWENRNVSRLGRKLSLQGYFTKRSHAGIVAFMVPDWWTVNQDYVCQVEDFQESIHHAFHQQSYSIIHRIDRRINTKYLFSVGSRFERLFVTDSVRNKIYSLLEIPLYFRWSSANDLLNPTRGSTIEYQTFPTMSFRKTPQYYIYNAVNYSFYLPVIGDEFLVLAQRLLVDSIASEHLHTVPVPKRIFGGDELCLRGYIYHTVSPRKKHRPHKNKLTGGRSGVFYTFESRFRLSKTIGLVPFFDIGNVYLTSLPTFGHRWFKSAGLGLRYFTPIGPIRVDIAVPFPRREGIDPRYNLNFSIGQTF